MRKLIDQSNIDPISAEYPKGRTRNKTESVNGTIFSEGLIGDIIQFFQKLIIDAGVAENDLPDNAMNGHQLIEAADKRYYKKHVQEIPEWNMVTGQSGAIGFQVSLPNEILIENIRDITAMIRNDDNTIYTKAGSEVISIGGDTLPTGAFVYVSGINGPNIGIQRIVGGGYDNAEYSRDDAGYYRGWITVTYTI